jgi:hypothetical protein
MKSIFKIAIAVGLGGFPPLYSQVMQTDWSGGPGVCGTVSSFGSTFCSSSPSVFYLFP